MASEREHRVLATLADAAAGAVCGFGFYMLGWLVLWYISSIDGRGLLNDLPRWAWYLRWRVFLWFLCGGALAGVLLRSRFFRRLENLILAFLLQR